MSGLGSVSQEALEDKGLRVTALSAAVSVVVNDGGYEEPGPAALEMAKDFYKFLAEASA